MNKKHDDSCTPRVLECDLSRFVYSAFGFFAQMNDLILVSSPINDVEGHN
jgi:hypothetical protein